MRRVISRSLWRKLMVTIVAIMGFVLLYEVSMFDSREAAPQGLVDPTAPAPGTRHLFTATAYCKGTTTASGVGVRTGIAASDPGVLPVGSVINITAGDTKYNGVYTIMDTGPKVQGRIVDLYMWSCHEALEFGRQPIELTVLRLGWSPSASTPSLIDRLFRRREEARRTAPAATAPPAPDTRGDGDDGAKGVNGVDGADGAKGVNGVDGVDGAKGVNGVDGVDGAKGATVPSREPSNAAPSDAPVAPVAPSSPSHPPPPIAPAASPPR